MIGNRFGWCFKENSEWNFRIAIRVLHTWPLWQPWVLTCLFHCFQAGRRGQDISSTREEDKRRSCFLNELCNTVPAFSSEQAQIFLKNSFMFVTQPSTRQQSLWLDLSSKRYNSRGTFDVSTRNYLQTHVWDGLSGIYIIFSCTHWSESALHICIQKWNCAARMSQRWRIVV